MEYRYRIQAPQGFDTHTSPCKVTVTIDGPIDSVPPPLVCNTEGWFNVKFIKKPPPELPIPKVDEPEIPGGG